MLKKVSCWLLDYFPSGFLFQFQQCWHLTSPSLHHKLCGLHLLLVDQTLVALYSPQLWQCCPMQQSNDVPSSVYQQVSPHVTAFLQDQWVPFLPCIYSKTENLMFTSKNNLLQTELSHAMPFLYLFPSLLQPIILFWSVGLTVVSTVMHKDCPKSLIGSKSKSIISTDL